MQFGELEELQKALTAGYGSDVAALTGGGALRVQSLDKTMMSTIQDNKHFRLVNELLKGKATATVDEWTEQKSVGGFPGGSSNTESGVIADATGDYARRVGVVKYLMTRRQVSVVLNVGTNIVAAEAVEQRNGALQLLTDTEFLSFEGDATVVPTEFDGIYTQIVAGVAAGQVDTDNVVDMAGQPLNSIAPFSNAAQVITAYGNFGTPTHFFCSQLTQSDLDSNLDPAFRVPLTSVQDAGIKLGSPVTGVRTSFGNIANFPDVFIRDEPQLKPFQVLYAAIATANTAQKPTLALAVASNAASKFAAGHAGNYYYLVTGVNKDGQSDGVISAQQAIAAGEQCTLTITASGGGLETGYAIYRSRKGGTNAPSDFRLVTRVAKAGATTTYIDRNLDIPGSVKAYMLNMLPGDASIKWQQYLPMLKFPLYPTNAAVIPWAQLLFGYLRIAKRRHHVVFKNIVPNGATWKPFS